MEGTETEEVQAPEGPHADDGAGGLAGSPTPGQEVTETDDTVGDEPGQREVRVEGRRGRERDPTEEAGEERVGLNASGRPYLSRRRVSETRGCRRSEEKEVRRVAGVGVGPGLGGLQQGECPVGGRPPPSLDKVRMPEGSKPWVKRCGTPEPL